LRNAILLAVLLLAACSGSTILGKDESRAKLAQHRKAYEWLAEELRTCGLPHLKASGDASGQCLGGIDKARLQTAMQTLGVKSAGWRDGDVWLITGTDGSESLGMDLSVASYLIRTRSPDPDRADPLTEAPHHWFYARHD
jgi:hypothetical protein